MKPSEPSAQPLALVVDDDPVLRKVASQALARAGLRVRETESGEQALEALAEELPGIVLLDVMMSGMDGYEACRRLRETAAGHHVPVLMLTGLDDLDSINRAYEAGATDFISKPINWGVLGHRVRYMLRAAETFKALAESQALLSNAQRIARLGSWSWDFGTGLGSWTEETYAVLGFTPGTVAPVVDTLIGRVHPEERDAVRGLMRGLRAGQRAPEAVHRLVLPGGETRHMRLHSDLRVDELGRVTGAFGTVQDITESTRAEERIRQLAYYDELTQLPNRHLFLENMAQALNHARRHGRVLAVLYMDLDQFKRVNETLGHSVGDRLLKEVAARLREGLRAHDAVTHGSGEAGVARLGGDEFCILLNEIGQFHDAAKVARRIVDSLVDPVEVDGNELFVTTAIGIALFPADGGDCETLLKNAAVAMHHAKSQGRNGCQFYGRAMNARALEKLAMESQLRKAIDRAEFELHFQPKLDLRSGRLTGAEALIRWHHPELGIVPPNDFIPLAEEAGLIVPIGEWVLETACRQSVAWQRAGLAPLPVAVNVSSPHFRHSGLLRTVARVLEQTGLPPQLLELEVTESMLMDSLESTLGTLHGLKDMGLRLCIDDFGTGYSSLAYLKRFPLDALKVDQSFVKDMPGAADDAAITSAIIAMAHSLKLEVVAEGVETQAQLDFLRARGCEYAQGFLISRPLPAPDLAALLGHAAPLKPPS